MSLEKKLSKLNKQLEKFKRQLNNAEAGITYNTKAREKALKEENMGNYKKIGEKLEYFTAQKAYMHKQIDEINLQITAIKLEIQNKEDTEKGLAFVKEMNVKLTEMLNMLDGIEKEDTVGSTTLALDIYKWYSTHKLDVLHDYWNHYESLGLRSSTDSFMRIYRILIENLGRIETHKVSFGEDMARSFRADKIVNTIRLFKNQIKDCIARSEKEQPKSILDKLKAVLE